MLFKKYGKIFYVIFLLILAYNFLQDRHIQAAESTYTMPVLNIKYFPLKNGALDEQITGMNDSVKQIRTKVETYTGEVMKTLEEGSRYHGYKDASATQSLVYMIVDSKEFLEPMPLSNNEIPWNPGIYRPDYFRILTDLGICNYVENQGVKEVWLWGYHYGNLEPVESNMAGPYGDISNSERIDDMPKCKKTYVLYNYNYSRGTPSAVHDHMHHIESVLGYIDNGLFWNQFVRPYGDAVIINRCGWTHSPPNTKSGYDYTNKTPVLTDCEDWKPEGGITQRLNCDKWNCNDLDFFIWWMQNIPGKDNNLSYQGGILRNWWDPIGDFDLVMVRNPSLLIPNVQPTPPSGQLGCNRKGQGDADCNGNVDFVDYDYYRRTVLLDPLVPANISADFNGDGETGVNDGRIISATLGL